MFWLFYFLLFVNIEPFWALLSYFFEVFSYRLIFFFLSDFLFSDFLCWVGSEKSILGLITKMTKVIKMPQLANFKCSGTYRNNNLQRKDQIVENVLGYSEIYLQRKFHWKYKGNLSISVVCHFLQILFLSNDFNEFGLGSSIWISMSVVKGLTTTIWIRDAFKIKKKPDLRTLSQKEGGGPDQIPKFVKCEIGTWGRGQANTNLSHF